MKHKNILNHLIPENKKELKLLCLLMVFYFSYSSLLIIKSSIIDNDVLADLYFSFDNNPIFKFGYQSIPPHPLLKYLTSPIILIGDLLVSLTGIYKLKTFLWVILCNYMIASSVLFIFKYLKNVINLNDRISVLLSVLFAITSILLILSFTPESFTISVFVITFIIYYTSLHLKKNKEIPTSEKIILSTIATGITITNFIICNIPYFFTKKPFKEKVKDLVILSIPMAIIFAWIGFRHSFIADTKSRLSWFTHTTGEFYEHVIDLFFGSPFFFSQLWIHKLRNDDTDVISMDYYHHWWQYLFIAIISSLIIASLIRNYKSKFVQILFLILVFNILIHIVIKYGLDEPFMFAAHWIYIVPLLLGWLYKSVSSEQQKNLYKLYLVIGIIMLFNNMHTLYNFINTAIKLFPEQ